MGVLFKGVRARGVRATGVGVAATPIISGTISVVNNTQFGGNRYGAYPFGFPSYGSFSVTPSGIIGLLYYEPGLGTGLTFMDGTYGSMVVSSNTIDGESIFNVTVDGITQTFTGGGGSMVLAGDVFNLVSKVGQTLALTVSYPVEAFGIGAAFGGGYYAGTIDYSGGAGTQKYYLIVSPISAQQSSIAYGLTTALSTSMTDGLANTNAVNNSNYPAAQYARALTTGGFTDWYIPAYYEMQILLYNLKSYNINNFVGTFDSLPVGANIYAVPPTSQYTTTVPAQTSVTRFKQGGAQALDSNSFSGPGYWTSTQRGGIFDMQNITGVAGNNGGWGGFGSDFKNGTRGLRCIRRVAVP